MKKIFTFILGLSMIVAVIACLLPTEVKNATKETLVKEDNGPQIGSIFMDDFNNSIFSSTAWTATGSGYWDVYTSAGWAYVRGKTVEANIPSGKHNEIQFELRFPNYDMSYNYCSVEVLQGASTTFGLEFYRQNSYYTIEDKLGAAAVLHTENTTSSTIKISIRNFNYTAYKAEVFIQVGAGSEMSIGLIDINNWNWDKIKLYANGFSMQYATMEIYHVEVFGELP
jgi:hypothetical protein